LIVIDNNACTKCLLCIETCRLDGLSFKDGVISIDKCNGCSVCLFACPVNAITLETSEG